MMFFFLITVGICLDQALKYLVRSRLAEYQSLPVIENIFHITFIWNDGAAFSILKGQRWFFVAVALPIVAAALGYALYHLYRGKKLPLLRKIALAFLIAGGVGNLIDRLRFGAVVDYLDFRVFPVFNLADSLIVASALLLAYDLFRDEKQQTKVKKSE